MATVQVRVSDLSGDMLREWFEIRVNDYPTKGKSLALDVSADEIRQLFGGKGRVVSKRGRKAS